MRRKSPFLDPHGVRGKRNAALNGGTKSCLNRKFIGRIRKKDSARRSRDCAAYAMSIYNGYNILNIMKVF
jgi:hypothetical protein